MIVHVLFMGSTLCGFGAGMFPGSWPEGHQWVDLSGGREHATCPACLGAPIPEDQKTVQAILVWLTRFAANLDAQAREHEARGSAFPHQLAAAEDRLLAAVYRGVAEQIAAGEWK